MLLIVELSLVPLIGFSLVGVFCIIFPGIVLNLQNYNGSMKGSLFDNNLEFRDSSLWIARIMGFVFIGIGVGIFMLINGWLDFLYS